MDSADRTERSTNRALNGPARGHANQQKKIEWIHLRGENALDIDKLCVCVCVSLKKQQCWGAEGDPSGHVEGVIEMPS